MWLQGFHYRIASGLVEVFSKWFRPSALYPLFYGGKHTDRGYWLLQAGEVKPVHASGLLGLEQLCHNFFNCGEFEVICNHPTEATTVPDMDNVAVLLLTKWGIVITALSKKLWRTDSPKTRQITHFADCVAELNASLLQKQRTIIINGY